MKSLAIIAVCFAPLTAAAAPPTIISFNIQGTKNGVAFNIPIANVTLAPLPLINGLYGGSFNSPELAKFLGDDPTTDAAFGVSIQMIGNGKATFGISNRLQHGISSPGPFVYVAGQPVLLPLYGSVTFQ